MFNAGYNVPYDVESCVVFRVENGDALPLAAVSFLCANCGKNNAFVVVGVCGGDFAKFSLETKLSNAEFA